MNKFMLFGRKYRNAEDGTGGGTDPAASGFDVGAAAASVGNDLGDTPSPSASEPSDVNTDWSALSDDSDDSSPASPAATEPAAPVPPVAPAVTPPVVPPTNAAPAEPPANPAAPVPPQPAADPAQAQQQPAQTPAEPTQPATPQVDPVEARKQYQASLQQYYALSPENAARLQTEPELVLPELAATLHLEVVDAIMNMLPQHVTQIAAGYIETTAKNKESEEAFFKDYPELRAHKDAVLRVGQMYRAANPKATKDQAIKAIGDFVMQSLGITRQVTTPPAAPMAPTAPAAPVNPFIPAQGGGGAQPPAQPGEWDFVMEPD